MLELPLDKIAADGSPFDIRPTWRECGELRESIRRFGILTPLEIAEETGDRYRLVHGFQRLRAAGRAEIPSVPVVVLDEPDARRVFLRKLEQSLFEGPLNELDKAMVLHRLRDSWDVTEDELLSSFLPRLGLRNDRRTLESHLALAHFPEPLQRAVENGLELPLALKLARRSADFRDLVIDAVQRFRLGRNKQRELFDLLDTCGTCGGQDTAEGDRITGQGQGRLSAASKQEALPGYRRLWQEVAGDGRNWGVILERLRARRYPLLAQRQRDFSGRCRDLRLPEGGHVSAPPHFEGDSLEIRLRLRSADEAAAAAAALAQACADERMARLFELL